VRFLVSVDSQLAVHGFEVGVFTLLRVHGEELQVDFVVVYEQESGYLGSGLGCSWNHGAGVLWCLGSGLGLDLGGFWAFFLPDWSLWRGSPG
jgi:hypothetical protein